MSTIDEVRATIERGVAATAEARDALRAAHERIQAARILAEATTSGHTNESADRGLDHLREADREIELILRRLAASEDAANRYLGLLK